MNLVEQTYTPTLIPPAPLWSIRRFAEPMEPEPPTQTISEVYTYQPGTAATEGADTAAFTGTVTATLSSMGLTVSSPVLGAPALKATAPTQRQAAVPSVVYGGRDRERVKARFRLLRRLPANHDNEGAAAAQPESVDAAIAFIDQMRDYPAPFYATLDDDGSAVIEFEDRGTGFFADMTFQGNGAVVCYVRHPNRPSQLIEGQLNSPSVSEFLASQMDVIL